MNHKKNGAPENGQQLGQDAHNLLRDAQGLGTYHELCHSVEIQQILQRWPILDLKTAQQVKPCHAPAAPERQSNVTLVTGTASSVGATTVVANLAKALQQQGKKVLVVDFSARQDLHFHLGDHEQSTTPAEDDTGQDISLLSTPSDPGSAQDTGQQPPHRLDIRLSETPGNSFDHVLIDCPWQAQAVFQQACALAGRLLLVTTPEPTAFQQIGPSLISVAAASQTDDINSYLLINRFNFSVPLQRDIHTLLYSRPPIKLAPAEIPHESRIVESLAQLGNVVSLVPGCDASRSFHFLGSWLLDPTTQQGKTVS